MCELEIEDWRLEINVNFQSRLSNFQSLLSFCKVCSRFVQHPHGKKYGERSANEQPDEASSNWLLSKKQQKQQVVEGVAENEEGEQGTDKRPFPPQQHHHPTRKQHPNNRRRQPPARVKVA